MGDRELSGNIMPCGECGQMVDGNEYHTYEMCLLYKLNLYREALGKPPVEIDIESEDRLIADKL